MKVVTLIFFFMTSLSTYGDVDLSKANFYRGWDDYLPDRGDDLAQEVRSKQQELKALYRDYEKELSQNCGRDLIGKMKNEDKCRLVRSRAPLVQALVTKINAELMVLEAHGNIIEGVEPKVKETSIPNPSMDRSARRASLYPIQQLHRKSGKGRHCEEVNTSYAVCDGIRYIANPTLINTLSRDVLKVVPQPQEEKGANKPGTLLLPQ